MIRRERTTGIALAITLMVVAIIVVLGSWMVQIGLHSAALANSDNTAQQSLYTAEAMLATVRDQLNQDNTYNGTPAASPGTVGHYKGSVTQGAVSTTFDVSITNNFNFANTSDMTAPNGVVVKPGYAYLLSQASWSDGRYTRYAAEMLQKPGSPFQSALAATGSGSNAINIQNGVKIDGFGGTYDPSNRLPTRVLTNSIASPAVSINAANKGDVHITGSLLVGPLPSGDSASSHIQITNPQNVTITGGESSLSQSVPATAVAPLNGVGSTDQNITRDRVLDPGSYRNLTVGGANTTLTLKPTSGIDYVFNDVTLNKNVHVVLQDPTKVTRVFFDDKFTVSTNATLNGGNNHAPAGMLQIYGTSNATKVDFTKDAPNVVSGYFSLFAPTATVILDQNTTVFGSVIGNSVSVNQNVNLHYDESLRDLVVTGYAGDVGSTATIIVLDHQRL